MLSMPAKTEHKPNKILIIAPAWVGDMIISQPLYQLLKQQNPSTQIDLLAPKSTLALASRMTQLTELIEQPLQHGELNLSMRYKLAKQLRNNHYSQAIVLPNSLKSALIPWWAKIKKRIGWLGEQRWLLLNDIRRLDKTKYTSLMQRYAALAFPKNMAPLASLPKPTLKISVENRKNCLQKFNLIQDQRPILALCPGAAYGAAKRWPVQHFAAVAQHYLDKNWQVWIFATAQEQKLADHIQRLTTGPCANLAGKTNLLDVIDLLSLAHLSITNDSGLMHVAAAINRPIVAIYGSTSPTYTPPLSDNACILQLDYDCIPCFKRECPLTGVQHLRCLQNLTPEMVIAASKGLLS